MDATTDKASTALATRSIKTVNWLLCKFVFPNVVNPVLQGMSAC